MSRRPLRVVRAALLLVAATAAPAHAVDTVTTANGDAWQIHDAAAPSLDTGSIRAITGNAFYGYGSIKVKVDDAPSTDPSSEFNGEAMRGFGLAYDDVDAFTSQSPVTLDGIQVARTIKVSKPGNWTRWLDSFTNVSNRAITLTVSFGGTLGYNLAPNQSQVVDSSSGDQLIGATDSWVEVATSGAAGPSLRGPSATVLGTPAPFTGALSGTGDHQTDPFDQALPTTGLDANFYGFKNVLTLAPGQTKSLLHYAVAGTAETTATAGQQIAAVRSTAASLASSPDLTDLSTGQRCTVANFDVASTPGFDPAACAAAQAPQTPAQRTPSRPVTTSPYDVVNKTITQMEADMAAGVTSSQQITRAYLDRIAAYDQGPFGFHTYIHVATDAMAQARAADDARAAGDTSDLLGIPVIVKDLYDTKDQPTTDGSLALEGFQPHADAFQVAKLRAAGAIILGKGNLSEFANSGSYSDSGYEMTANAFTPSKTSLGSSGGPAVATALSLAGFAMGTQTGVSLYAPSTGASLVSLRGTDGISSGSGVMPLTYLQDFEGPIARTTTDLARILNATTGTDPNDPNTLHDDAGAKRPADYTAALDPNALQGKRIGYVPAAFEANPSYGESDGTGAALEARFADLQAAGATLVPITAPAPSAPPSPKLSGSRTEEGWQHYFDQQVDPPYHTASGVLSSPRVLPYNRQTLAPQPRLSQADIDAIFAYRDAYKASYRQWMDDAGVDAVVYPGFRSDVYDNDGAQTLSSDRNSGVPTSNVGLPTLILPVGANPDGDPMSLQIVGRAFDDAKVLGFGYALELELGGKGHLLSPQAPPLAYDPTATPAPITEPTPVPPSTSSPTVPSEEGTAPAAVPAPGAPAAPTRTPTPTPTPTLKLSFGKLGRLRLGRVRLSVLNRGTSTASGTVVLRYRGRTVGKGSLVVGAGKRVSVSVRLSPSGRRALSGHTRPKLRARFTLRRTSGVAKATTVTLTTRS